MKKPEKNHDTGLRILEVLKILLDGDLTKNELIEKLRANQDVEGVYTQEAFLKYFNTFEMLGLKLKRNKGSYTLENAILRANLNSKEQKALLKLTESIKILNNKSDEAVVKNFILRLDKYVDINLQKKLEEVSKIENSIYNSNVRANVIKTLKNMLYDEQTVSITYKKRDNTEETLNVELKEIIEKNNCVFVVCYNPSLGRNKKISIDSIISLTQTPKKVSGKTCLNSVVFEIYGRLVSGYKLKPSEKVLNFSNNHLTISNTAEDKDSLLLRLLKYGENCKIIKPTSLQEEFISLTNEILKNLEAS